MSSSSEISTIKNLRKQIKELQERMAALSSDVDSLLHEHEEEEQQEELIELEVVYSPELRLYDSQEDQDDEPLKEDIGLYETDIDF